MRADNNERSRIAWERGLVERMRRDEPRAFAAFFTAFRPLLLREARRLNVEPALREELVDECLGDVAMRLRRYTAPVPRSLKPYLVKALRKQHYLWRRAERGREAGLDAGAEEYAALGVPMTTAASVSEGTLRASAGAEWATTSPSTALERLWSMVEEGLTPEEEMILNWVSRHMSGSQIAQWLGVTHGAARNRIMRLRARLKDALTRHAACFVGRERLEINAFFRRMDTLGAGVAEGGGAAGTGGAIPRQPQTRGTNDRGKREA